MVLKGVPRISRWRPSDVVLSRNLALGPPTALPPKPALRPTTAIRPIATSAVATYSIVLKMTTCGATIALGGTTSPTKT